MPDPCAWMNFLPWPFITFIVDKHMAPGQFCLLDRAVYATESTFGALFALNLAATYRPELPHAVCLG